MGKINNISIIGSGNVATHIGVALKNAGLKIDCVYSRNQFNADILAKKLNATGVDKVDLVFGESDLYIFAVSDTIIETLAKQLSDYLGYKPLVVHTSGLVSSTVFDPYFNEFGSFYPLQTFTKNRVVDIKEIPLLLAGNSYEVESKIMKLAELISNNTKFINDEERKVLHVAAVYANNFTNYLYSISENILTNENIDFNLLFPLIKETAQKIIDGENPVDVQTGPAMRNDDSTLQSHLEYLKKYPMFQKIYELITKSIKVNNRIK